MSQGDGDDYFNEPGEESNYEDYSDSYSSGSEDDDYEVKGIKCEACRVISRRGAFPDHPEHKKLQKCVLCWKEYLDYVWENRFPRFTPDHSKHIKRVKKSSTEPQNPDRQGYRESAPSP